MVSQVSVEIYDTVMLEPFQKVLRTLLYARGGSGAVRARMAFSSIHKGVCLHNVTIS